METIFIIVSIVVAVAILYFSSRAKKKRNPNCTCGNSGCCTGTCQRCDCKDECD